MICWLRALTITTIAACCALPGYAADFTWFRLPNGTEGWIEFASNTAGGQNRIHVFPRLIGPNDRDAQTRVEARDDGVVVDFMLQSPTTGNAATFVDQVLTQVAGLPSQKSRDYQVDLPNITQAEVRVVRDGRVLGRKVYDAKLPSITVGSIKITTDNASERNALLEGKFRLEATMSLPQASYSGLSVTVSERVAVEAKIEALKSIVTSQSVSGGKFLFFDWRRQSARNVVTQSVTQSQTGVGTKKMSVYSIDADDAMLAKVEKLLGFEGLSRDKVIENHLKAAQRAEEAKDMELAKLHREYVSKLDNTTPKVQADLLEKALTALQGKQANIAAFLANGIAFSDASSVGVSRFQGLGRVSSVDESSSDFSELKLTTANVKFMVSEGPFPLTDKQVIGSKAPNEQSATLALINAVKRDDLGRARYSLLAGGQPNGMEGPGMRTPLMNAAAQCNKEMVGMLLDAQANPALRDSAGRRARDYAKFAGCGAAVDLIDVVRLSRFKLKLQTEPGMSLLSLQVEDRGAILPLERTNPFIGLVAAGDKLLRMVLKVRLWVPEEVYRMAPMYYDAQPFLGIVRSSNGNPLRVYDVEDVVRLVVDLPAGDVDLVRALRFDQKKRMFVLADDLGGDIPTSDDIPHMNDNLHFGVGPAARMPRIEAQECVSWRKISPGSLVEECAQWGNR